MSSEGRWRGAGEVPEYWRLFWSCNGGLVDCLVIAEVLEMRRNSAGAVLKMLWRCSGGIGEILKSLGTIRTMKKTYWGRGLEI